MAESRRPILRRDISRTKKIESTTWGVPRFDNVSLQAFWSMNQTSLSITYSFLFLRHPTNRVLHRPEAMAIKIIHIHCNITKHCADRYSSHSTIDI